MQNIGKIKKRIGNCKPYLSVIILFVLSLIVFVSILGDVLTDNKIIELDLFISSNITLFWNPILNDIMIFITNIISPFPLLVLSFLLCLFLICKKRYQEAFVLVSSSLAGRLSEVIIKDLIQRVRPTNPLIEATGYSFPSGHATISVIFFVFLIYCFKDDIKNKLLRIIFISASILLFLLIGLSRIYLKVHWFSDVLAGFSLGAFWLSFFILLSKFIKRDNIPS